MRDYRGPPLELTPEQKKRIKRRRDRERMLASSQNRNWDSLFQVDSNEVHGNSGEAEDEMEPVKIVRPADPGLRSLIGNFFKTFNGASMSESVFGLDIAGMIDHTEGVYKGHCSILYKLPSTIGAQTRERPAENLKLPAPMTLKSLLGTRHYKGTRSMLGARFELAKKLVRAVCLLHSTGWLNKNIRAESVMFCPQCASALQEDRYEMKVEIDVSKPVLMGYIFSRPDDIIQRSAQSAGQTDDHSIGDRPAPDESMSVQTWDDPIGYSAQWKDKAGTLRSSSIYGHNILEKKREPEEQKQSNISGVTLDCYQHPAKHASPKRLYRYAYDVYSLGVLLLEVGLWKQLQTYEDSGFNYDRGPLRAKEMDLPRVPEGPEMDMRRHLCGCRTELPDD